MKCKKLIACFKELDLKIDIELFEDRVLAQKVACLLQLKGIKLGYDFGLYVRGPYSPALTQDLYRYNADFKCFKTDVKLTKGERAISEGLRTVLGFSPTILEIGATYGYFNMIEGLDPVESQRRVKRMKPFFSDAQMAIGISKAKQFLFEPTQGQMQELKKELAVWQNVAMSSLGRSKE